MTADKKPDTRTVIVGNEPACGAPKNWPWGYLPCGCRNDGHGRHIYR